MGQTVPPPSTSNSLSAVQGSATNPKCSPVVTPHLRPRTGHCQPSQSHLKKNSAIQEHRISFSYRNHQSFFPNQTSIHLFIPLLHKVLSSFFLLRKFSVALLGELDDCWQYTIKPRSLEEKCLEIPPACLLSQEDGDYLYLSLGLTGGLLAI